MSGCSSAWASDGDRARLRDAFDDDRQRDRHCHGLARGSVVGGWSRPGEGTRRASSRRRSLSGLHLRPRPCARAGGARVMRRGDARRPRPRAPSLRREPCRGGESYRQVVERTRRFLDDLFPELDGSRVLLIAHSANRWALQHLLLGAPLEDIIAAPFAWQEGWEYTLSGQLSVQG